MELINISKGLLQLHSLTQFHYSLNQHHKFLKPILNDPRSRPLLRFNPSFCSPVSNKSTDYYDDDDKEEELVEVVGIGNRTDAVFDFCSNSPFVSPALSFPSLKNSQSYAGNVFIVVVVVANGVSEHHMRVLDEIVNRVKSTKGLAVGIIVKPFSFERRSRRGQGEVKGLLEKLREQTDFCIGIDTDVLLEKDCFVTLDEALKTANTAVLMAINAVSFLVSKSKKKKKLVTFSLQDNDNMKELLQVSEILEILKGYKQAEVGFGDGNNVKTSTTRAIYDCPFLSAAGLKDLDGIVIGFIASSEGIEKRDIRVFLTTLRKNSDFKGQIILCLVHDTILEPNHIITTVITVRSRKGHQESSIFSQLSQRFPFIFNLLKCQPSETHNRDKNPTSLGAIDTLEMPDLISANSDIEEGFGNYSAEFQTLLANNDDEVYNLSVSEANENGFPEPASSYSNFYDGNNKGVTSYEREPLSRIFEPVYQEECGNDSGDTSLLGILSIVKLPVGVKPSAELKDSLYNSDNSDQQKEVVDENIKSQQINITPPRVSSNTSTDAGFEAVSELFDTGSVLKGATDNISKREGVVSARAASMLEAERRSEKKWNPIVEMKYRRGLYKGRCQGGLPEGKGRLSLSDGSIYDGMWRSGKRSGFGTFKFSNGDFYQGSWRDDVMHGKGWLYFETGDRWFVNFWKGKANGEGRFYSKFGETFFGHFKDGWRHGHFLCISVDGERYLENWDEGVRVSRRKQLDADSGREQCSKDSEHNN